MRDFFFQIVLLLVGAIIGAVAQIIEKISLRKMLRILSGLLVAFSLVG